VLLVAIPTAARVKTDGGLFRPHTFVVSRVAAAGIKPGTPLATVQGAWGRPAEVERVHRIYRRRVYADRVAHWRNRTGTTTRPIEVMLRRNKVVAIILVLGPSGPTSRLHTTKGDRRGTPASSIVKHWPKAKRMNSCCSTVFWYVVPAAESDFVLAFRLPPGRPARLDAFFLGSREAFACELNECIPE